MADPHLLRDWLAGDGSAPYRIPETARGDPLWLARTERGLELRDVVDGRGVIADFCAIDLRTGTGNLSRRQPIARAVGAKTTTVVDATAGFGHDAALLAYMGFRVTALERSPIVAALLDDALARVRADPFYSHALGDRLRIVNTDARTSIEGRPDAVYIDPMFPPKRKKGALARKGVRLLRTLVGVDDDAAELLAAARACAHRVVVKRPTWAQPIGDEPTLAIGAKLVRYDVYVGGTGANPGAAIEQLIR